MEGKYWIQRVDDNSIFDEVDEYTYKHRFDVVENDGDTCYTGQAVVMEGGNMRLEGVFSVKQLSIITRFLGVQPITSSIPGGFVHTPAVVKIRRPRGNPILHHMNGDNYVLMPKKKAA